MQNPSGMSKEIRAIEISRESLSVGSTFTESIALQSPLSAQFIHWSKSLAGFMLAAWSELCQTPRGKDRGFLSSSRLQKELEQFVPGQWFVQELFTQSKPKSNPSTRCRDVWWSEAPGCKGAVGVAAVLPPHSLHSPGKHHAHFPRIFKNLVSRRALLYLPLYCVLAYCQVLSQR